MPSFPSQGPTQESAYVRNTMPAMFAPGEQPFDILAPTPRPPQSPSWLNPNTSLESTLQGAVGTENVEDQEWPPLRFGRGERPDAEDEDEPDSEEEFVPRARPLDPLRGTEQGRATPNSSSPTITKQLEAVSVQEHGDMQDHYESQHPPSTSSSDPHVHAHVQFPFSPEHPSASASASAGAPVPQNEAEVNDGEIPFGSTPTPGTAQSSSFFS
jgi:hypothetical protein